MTLKICELVSILLSALVLGAIWGPWLALSRSVATFQADVFLAVSHRMIRNLEPVMTLLIPAAMLSIVPVVLISYDQRPKTAYLTLAGFGFLVVAVFVGVLVQVSIVSKMRMWTISRRRCRTTGKEIRDRWKAVQVVRIVTSIAGLALLVIGAIIWFLNDVNAALEASAHQEPLPFLRRAMPWPGSTPRRHFPKACSRSLAPSRHRTRIVYHTRVSLPAAVS